jgi:hypothetical protein
MSISRRSFTYGSAVKTSDLPGLGVPQSLIAVLAREFGKSPTGTLIGGIDPEWDDLPRPGRDVGPFVYDWSDADERDRGR